MYHTAIKETAPYYYLVQDKNKKIISGNGRTSSKFLVFIYHSRDLVQLIPQTCKRFCFVYIVKKPSMTERHDWVHTSKVAKTKYFVVVDRLLKFKETFNRSAKFKSIIDLPFFHQVPIDLNILNNIFKLL